MNRIADNDNNDDNDDKSTSEDWESPDENEPDVSDPEFEVDETIAAKEGVLYEFNDDGQLNLGERTTAVLRHILERARKRQEIFTERVVALSESHGETAIDWDSDFETDSEEGESSEDDEDEWKGIPE